MTMTNKNENPAKLLGAAICDAIGVDARSVDGIDLRLRARELPRATIYSHVIKDYQVERLTKIFELSSWYAAIDLEDVTSIVDDWVESIPVPAKGGDA